MKQTEITIPAEYLSSFHINGMRGRILSIPHSKPKKRKKSPELLIIYGHHTSLERMYSTALSAAEFGNVTMPDLPGFGGMDSFYVIGKKPTLDNMADYLATFIKLYYKNRKFHIAGMSHGFLVVTKMLQKYPRFKEQVGLVVSIVGFSKRDDFTMSPSFYNSLLYGSKVAKTKLGSFVISNIFITKPTINAAYRFIGDKNVKMKDSSEDERKKRINFEVFLWKCNDIRTYFFTTAAFLSVDLTGKKVNKDLHHISVDNDQYFDHNKVVANLSKIYQSITVHHAKMPNHAPTVISDVKQAGKIFPSSLKKVLKTL